jgi:hypothetical protein
LPEILPGEAVSPGTRIWSFVNVPALTVTDGLVLAVLVPSVASVAVMVAVPDVLRVTVRVAVPVESAVLEGSVAFASLDVMATVSVEVARFQLLSTDLMVTLNDVPAVRADGVPVLPVLVPGAAVSPGKSSWIFAKAPVLIVMDGLVFAVLVPSVMSVAVKVAVPAVFRVTENVPVPDESAALDGNAAFESVDVIPTVCVELTVFQFASTALTVTENAVPAVCADGAPVLPVELPGEAVSPGAINCNLVKVPAVADTDGLVSDDLVPSLISLAVTVAVPAVLNVTLKVLMPATRAALTGSVAFASLEVIPTV